MLNYTYYNPAKVVFGTDAGIRLKELLHAEGSSSLLLVYSGDFIKELGIYDLVTSVCAELKIAFYENGDVVPNPEISLVRELVELGKSQQVDFVLAVGGGSAIDTAKAVALGIPYAGDVWDFFVKDVAPQQVLPIGVIATLPASGSESSDCAILSNENLKLGFEHADIIPRFAILNPEYTLGLPAYQTACGIADILSHLLERYFSDVPHTDVTDFLLEGAVRALHINAGHLLRNPSDYDSRAEIQQLALIAHNNLLDTGRRADWGTHRIEHEVSAQYGITHGEGMAVLLPAWIRYAARKKPGKPAQLAHRVYQVDYYTHSAGDMAEQLAALLENFFKSLSLKTTLTQLGIDERYFDVMAARATKNDTQTVGHYLILGQNDVVEILRLAL